MSHRTKEMTRHHVPYLIWMSSLFLSGDGLAHLCKSLFWLEVEVHYSGGVTLEQNNLFCLEGRIENQTCLNWRKFSGIKDAIFTQYLI